MLLRFLLVACFAVCSANARTLAEIKQSFIQMGMECNKEHPISLDEMMLLQKHKLPETKNVKCAMACVFRKANWLTADNNLDFSKAEELIEKDLEADATKKANAMKILESCRTVNNETNLAKDTAGCERSYLLTRCILENAPKFGFDLKNLHI